MNVQAAKKLSLKKETLRQIDSSQLAQLDGAVGGSTPLCVGVIIGLTITIMAND
ncbi:hypothetical protein A176_005600 [Myxococcus hansupus]|uniref:Class IIb bacteriocin, lactobin A/cerein 7B family n=1 Tax=Pseudomyxococcus hansupus TaxID=1297742 RepID=A0A0H4X476_9BACT|nr:hypothetical protein [Myxococcus hansupus]AKQ68688.1 hypothetical protein A176_005600 [Myxococcus hansupus]